jgi:transketolase
MSVVRTDFSEKQSLREAFGKTLAEIGSERPEVVAFANGLAGSLRIKNYFQKQFPERTFNLGLTEQATLAIAGGISMTGKIPVYGSFSVFAVERAYESIRQNIGYSRLNVKIVGCYCGSADSKDGASHQCFEDIALMRVLPEMVILAPADAVEVAQATRAMIEYQGPVYMRMSGSSDEPMLFGDDYHFEIGKNVTMRSGKDISIFATGVMVSRVLDAAKILEQEGIEAEVINVSTIKPLDEASVLKSAEKTRLVMTVEDHNVIGGLGGAIAELLADKLPTQVVRVGMPDRWGESAPSQNEFLNHFGFGGEDIVKKVKEVVREAA